MIPWYLEVLMGWIRRIRNEDEEPEYNKDMAASIEGGDTLSEDDSWDPDDILGKPLTIETKMFTAEVTDMYKMPGMFVLDIITTEAALQVPKLVSLFKLAIRDPKKAEDLNILSFDELIEATIQWTEKSSPSKKKWTF